MALRSDHPVASQSEAVRVVQRIVDGVNTGYDLIEWKQFAPNWQKRAKVFCEFEILCHANKKHEVGWATCMHVINGLSDATNGTKRFNPKVGNAGFHRHVEVHQIKEKEQNKLTAVSENRKKTVIQAAAFACALDSLPFTFCEGRKKGMLEFVKSLLEVGRCYSNGTFYRCEEVTSIWEHCA